jgi:signal transduction histidine kinase
LVFNLAENAIKYTPAGGQIEITLKQRDGMAVLEVTDDGPGIPPDAREHIFDRFYRGDPTREGGGTGLGLALVRSIVDLHQGQIRVSSAPGEGSCFFVTLPLATDADARQSKD